MGKKDPRVDAYINKAGDFAKPVLRHLRELAHSTCPEVEEAIKWRAPAFMYRGILYMTAAFKEHCALVFWSGAIRDAINKGKSKDAWGHLGKIRSLSDLPKDSVLIKGIREAMKLNESGYKKASRKVSKKPPLIIPTDVMANLKKNKKALAVFEGFSPSHQREYVEWIMEAKREETREKRIKEMLQMLIGGKTRNWKYE